MKDSIGSFEVGRNMCLRLYINVKEPGVEKLVEEYLGKDKKLYAAFMDLKKAYDRVNRRESE